MNHISLYKDTSKIDWKTPVVIDFESYYDKEWSLSKITTEKYIRGDQWECIGVSIKVGDKPAKFYRHETGLPIIAELVKRLPTSPFISHNNSFDMAILGLRYGIHPNFMVDTMVMAKLCGFDRVAGGTSLAKLSDQLEKMGLVNKVKGTTVHNMLGVHAADMTEQQWQEYGDYCVLDTDLCYALYMYMIDKVPTQELIMADITTKMWTRPMIELDVPLLESYAERLATEREQMLSRISGDLGFPTTEALLKSLRSSKKFVALLESLQVEVPMKWSEKQEKMIPAVSKTDIAFLELLEHENELVRTLVETKLGTMSSMEQTRTATFLDIASRGRMPIPLRYASAHTGRYGGCFTADTMVCLKSKNPYDGSPYYANIIDATPDTLIWNGEEFVEHDGVICNGVQEVINYDGLCGTRGHKVFTKSGVVSLEYARDNKLPIINCPLPSATTIYPIQGTRPPMPHADGAVVPVYDILNAGKDHKYMANGKLVHNSDKVNLQNLSKRTKEPVLRRSLRARKGHIVLASDSGQIECLAGDGLVLTNNGLKQITNISIDDLLWDGVEYVSHNGVILKGVKDVITYSGITATPEHVVFTADGRKLTLDEAAAERAEILVGEREGEPVRSVGCLGQTSTPAGETNAVGEVRLWNRETCQSERLTTWQEQELQSVRQSQILEYTNKASPTTASTLQRFGRAVQGEQIFQSYLQRCGEQIHKLRALCELCLGQFPYGRLSWVGDRPCGYERSLRTGQYPIGYERTERSEPKGQCNGGIYGRANERKQIRKGLYTKLPQRLGIRPSSFGVDGRTDNTKSPKKKQENVFLSGRCVFQSRFFQKIQQWAGANKSFVQSSERRFTERGNLITGTIPVYDIVNAGPRNRFCYNGMIVSNCRINALMSNQQDLTQLFLDGRDPYVDMATAIFNKSYDEIIHEAKVVGSKEGKKMRNLGKEAVLACISHDTEVLCKRGWVAIQDVQADDLLWDGENWVTHSGVVPMGEKDCIDFGGVNMTPDHKVFNGIDWEEAQYANSSEVRGWAIRHLPNTE